MADERVAVPTMADLHLALCHLLAELLQGVRLVHAVQRGFVSIGYPDVHSD